MKYNVGDTIKATHEDGTVIQGVLSTVDYDNSAYLKTAGWGIKTLKREGFTIEVIARAPRPLPTEAFAVIQWREEGAYLPRIAVRSDNSLYPAAHSDKHAWWTNRWWSEQELLRMIGNHEWVRLVPEDSP